MIVYSDLLQFFLVSRVQGFIEVYSRQCETIKKRYHKSFEVSKTCHL